MNAPATFAARIAATYAMHDSFDAWRLRDTETMTPIPLSAATLADALAEAQNPCGHGDTLFILQTHAHTEKQTLHAWRIRRGARVYRVDPLTSIPGFVHPLKPDPLFSFAVDAFDPTAPFSAMPRPVRQPDWEAIGIDYPEGRS